MAKKRKIVKPGKSVSRKKPVSKSGKKIPSKKTKPKKHVTNTKRKKAPAKTRTRNKGIHRQKKTNRKTSVSKGKQLPKKKLVRKTSGKSKVSVHTKQSRSSRKGVKQNVKPITRKIKKSDGAIKATKSNRGNTPQIDFTFSKVRKVDKKIILFKENAEKYFTQQLKPGKKKPAKGLIVTVRDKSGREKTIVSRFDFVVNPQTATKFVADMLDSMKEDFMEWVEMEESGDVLDDTDSNPYGNYNPDTITEITVKFIY